jgi:hypothetical protein
MKIRRITALFTFLAMLVAPLCTPFCRSHVCAASSQEENCHTSSAAHGNANKASLVSVQTCGLQELPAAALSKTTNSPDFAKQRHAPRPSLHLVSSPPVFKAVTGTQSPQPNSESCFETVPAQQVVLRI